MNAQKQVNNRRNFTSANEIPPEYRAAIQAMIEAEMRRRYIDPNAAAFSVEQFCRHYGIGKQTAYEQIKAGHLVAHRPPDCDRTLIRRVDAERWIESSPTGLRRWRSPTTRRNP